MEQELFELGRCQFQLGNLAVAKTALDRAINIQPNYIDAHLTLVEFHARQGDLNQAAENLNNALRIAPRDRRVLKIQKLLEKEGKR